MKRLISQKVYNDLIPLTEEQKKKHQRHEIADFLIENPELFQTYTLGGPLGNIDVVELCVLEPNELKDYFEFILWRRREQAKPDVSFSFEIKSVGVNNENK